MKACLLLAMLLPLGGIAQINCGKFISVVVTNDANGNRWATVKYYTEPAPSNTIMLQFTAPSEPQWYNWQYAPSHNGGRLTNQFTRAGIQDQDELFRMGTNIYDFDWHFPAFNTYSTNSGSLGTNLPPLPEGDSLMLSQELMIEYGRGNSGLLKAIYPPTRFERLR